MQTIKKCFYLLLATLITAKANAEVFAPNPSASNQYLWDTILGGGSFSLWSTTTRGACRAALFLISGWIILGLYQAVFVKGNVDQSDGIWYFFRVLLILITFNSIMSW